MRAEMTTDDIRRMGREMEDELVVVTAYRMRDNAKVRWCCKLQVRRGDED